MSIICLRYLHRRNKKDFDRLETQYENLTRNQARVIEQCLEKAEGIKYAKTLPHFQK